METIWNIPREHNSCDTRKEEAGRNVRLLSTQCCQSRSHILITEYDRIEMIIISVGQSGLEFDKSEYFSFIGNVDIFYIAGIKSVARLEWVFQF